MYNYTASTLAIRAKCSLSFHYLPLTDDKPFCFHNPHCHFFINPSFLSGYLLGFSSPLASKSLFHGGRRRLRIFYRRRDLDLTGLLAEPEEESIEGKRGIGSCRSEGFSSDFDSKVSNRKKGASHDEVHLAEEEVHKYVDDSWRERRCSSRRDESTKRNGSFRGFEVKDVDEKVDQRANLARKVSISESDGFSSDFDSKVHGVERRRAGGESLVGFSNRKKGSRHDEVHKYVDDSWRERRCSSKRDVALDSRNDESAKRNGSFRQVSISESGLDRRSKNVTRIDEVQLEDVKRASVNVRKMERGENSVSAARQNSDIEHSLADDRRRGLQKQSKIENLHYNDAERDESTKRNGSFRQVSISESGLDRRSKNGTRIDEVQLEDVKRTSVNVRKMERGENSVSAARENSERLQKQSKIADLYYNDSKRTAYSQRDFQETSSRVYLDRGTLEQDESRRRTQRLNEVSFVDENRSEGGKDKLTMAGNSIQLRGGERKKIVRGAVELDDAQRNTQKLSKVSEVLSSVPAKRDKGTQVEMHDAYYDQIEISRFNANNIVDSNQVSSVREQNDQVSKQTYLLYGAKIESETSEFDLITSNNSRISSLQDTYNSRIENEKQFSSAGTSSSALIREQEIQKNSFTGESSQSESMDMTSTGGLHGFSNPQPTLSDTNYDAGYQKIQHGTNYSAGKFDKSSASHASELVGKLQKEIVNKRDGVQIGKQGRRDVQATLRIENRNETSSTMSTQERKERQSSLLVGESSQYKTMKVASTGSLGDDFDRADTYSEMGDHSHRDDVLHITNDAIESTKRLDKSSAFHVDEFVDEMRQEILNESGKESNISSRFQIEESDKRKGLFLSGLEMRGPSEEIWGQIESSQKTSNEEPEENSLTLEAVDLTTPLETAIGRSPKSLWSYVADIIRMSWILRDHSNSKNSKFDKRTSSNESLSSEAWFSGPELEEDGAGDEAQKTKKTGLLKEAGLVKESVKLPLQESQKGDRLAVIEPTSSILSGLSDRTASPSEEVEHTQDLKSSQTITEQKLQSKSEAALSSITDGVESRVRDRVRVLKPSSSYPAAVMRVGFSSSITQSTGAVQMESAQVDKENNSSLENFEQPLASTVDSGLPRFTDLEEVDKPGSIPELGLDPFSEKLTVVGGTEEGGIKQRKFQRSKQVLSEQFDEWEDAFKRENEQKKLDEFFMREAIVEAKKSADAWEVPVGAVLVQNGRIVARGCNMVEELRDSTAHAEMICIREASNVLRNWRLAETTLYVTLEPCPMCAGAILQARIDTVVWGAPNRLLGADGSWVRLFPGGDGGSSSMNPPSQMVGPVHPFHPKITIRRGILETECGEVMQQFFKLRRKKDKKPESSPPSCLPISNRPTKFFSKLHNIFGMMFCL